MSHKDLIEKLAAEASVVKRPLGAGISTAVWVGCSILLLAAAFATVLTLRNDLSSVAGRVWFLLNLLSLVAVFIFASYAGFVSSIPGRARPVKALAAVQLALLGFFLTLIPSLLHMPFENSFRLGINLSGLKCTCALALLGVVPALLLFFAVRRLAPVDRSSTAKMVGLAMGAMGAFGLSFDCMVPNAVHILVYHGLPIVLLGLAGVLVGDKILRW